jgi:hypothetical protein
MTPTPITDAVAAQNLSREDLIIALRQMERVMKPLQLALHSVLKGPAQRDVRRDYFPGAGAKSLPVLTYSRSAIKAYWAYSDFYLNPKPEPTATPL